LNLEALQGVLVTKRNRDFDPEDLVRRQVTAALDTPSFINFGVEKFVQIASTEPRPDERCAQ